MNVIIADDASSLASQVATDLAQLMKVSQDPLVCTASGDSPAGTYKELVRRVVNKELDVSNWNYVGLDEWVGLNGDDEGSCRYHLDRQLYRPLQVTDNHLCFFDGRASDLAKQCREIDEFIEQHKGIDVLIAGLGLNGHVGMNEPASDANNYTHVADLDPITKKTGQKYFKNATELTQGITLGLANFREARHVFLIVTGAHKAAIVQTVLEGEMTNEVPATLLRKHPGLTIYLDREAASALKGK